jgi:hypothetical protein
MRGIGEVRILILLSGLSVRRGAGAARRYLGSGPRG